MAINTEIEAIVPLRPDDQSLTTIENPSPPPSTATPPTIAEEIGVVRTRKRRLSWLAPAIVGVVGLAVSASLGGLLLSTGSQRDTARQQLASSQSTLRAARADAAAKAVVARYARIDITDSGRVLTDYETVVACNDFSQCRTAAQQMLSDMQTFQSDRGAATVPASLASADGSLRDALSAGIAGNQEFISGIDNNDDAKAKDGGNKVDAAMLSLAKASVALGSALQ